MEYDGIPSNRQNSNIVLVLVHVISYFITVPRKSHSMRKQMNEGNHLFQVINAEDTVVFRGL